MKSKNLVYLLVGVLALAGCKKTNQNSETNSNTPSPSITATESQRPSTDSNSSTSSAEQIEHKAPLVSALPEGTITRTFNGTFDTMLDDFSSETLSGSNSNGVVSTAPRLRVLVDSANGDFPSSEDASIYKMATGTYNIHAYEGIGFKIRKVGDGKLDLSNLVLALRGDDAYKVFEINLQDAVNPDGDPLDELTEDWQEMVVAPNLSIEDDTEEYEMRNSSEKSGVKVLDNIIGFHLYAKGECSQLIEIESVFLSNAGEKTTLDAFGRSAVNKADDTCYWRDSTGFIVGKNIMLNNQASYQTASSEQIADHENLVLTMMGDSSNTSIVPVTSSGELSAVSWADLKDNEGNAVANAVNGAFHSFVINFANSGITTNDVVAFKIVSASEVYLSEIFLSNLEDKVAATEYPRIDVTNISMFDNFNRTQSGFNGDYDASASNQVVIDAGLYYALSYNNGDKVSVADGHVTFDATDLGETDYINFKEGKDAYTDQQYLVLSVKAEDGATLDNFRFNVGSGVTYINQMYSASGLKLPTLGDTNYPYVTDDGYTWLIIDLKESNMEPADYIDFYYSGTGKLLIDCIFYADAYHNYEETPIVTEKVVDLSGYAYVEGFSNTDATLLKLTLSSTTEDQNLNSLRIEGPNGTVWFKDGAMIDAKGNVISGDTIVTEEGITLLIDLEASNLGIVGSFHIHAGGFNDSTGDLTITASTLTDVLFATTVIEENTITDLSGYAYVGGFDNTDGKYLQVKVSSTTEGQNLNSLRIEGPNGTVWFKDGAMIDTKGNVISGDTIVTEEGVTLLIDLQASNLGVAGSFHIHAGGFNDSTGDLTIEVKTLSEKAYSEILTELEQ